MGLGSDAIELVIRLKDEGYLNGNLSVVEIGAQQLANSFLEARYRLIDVGRLFQAAPPCPLPGARPTHIVHGGSEHLAADAPAARDFWTWLGFDYAAIDIDGSPGSIPLDLNYDSVSKDELGRYQLVTNFGTTEHVANQLNAFKVIHDLVRHGGVMIHHLPMQGMLNHGLVNYNPKFFWMLGRSNGYRIVYLNVSAATSYYALPENITGSILPFEPDIEMRRHAYRVADMMIVVVMQKVFDTPYVAPLDVNTGTRTTNTALEERYWSVFKPNAFDDLTCSLSGGGQQARRQEIANNDLASSLTPLCSDQGAGQPNARARLVNDIVDTLSHDHCSVSWGDRLLTLDKSADFKEEPSFAKAFAAIRGSHQYDQYEGPDSIAWRLNTLVWAGRYALRTGGDFVECGTFKGDMAWVVLQTIGAERIRRFWLFDSFEGFSADYSSSEDFPENPGFLDFANGFYRQPGLYEYVRERFAPFANVTLIKGFLPEALDATTPDRIGFLHIDLNSPRAEIAVLERLFDRVLPGGVIVFDDYGWKMFHKQKEAEDDFMRRKGYEILELPTGQGLVAKR